MGRPLGQHFLFQRPILERIALSACPRPEPLVIEIGPGPGALTECLRERCERMVAVELDATLASSLEARYHDDAGFTLVNADVMATDLTQWGRAVVCGNLPYYITSPIIERVLELGPLLERAVFLIQKEVADRLAAEPGSRDYGYLSVATQLLCRVERQFIVKPSSFRPPPKVDSAVVRLTPHTAPLEVDRAAFLKFASAAFRQKRKTLRNNLSGAWPAISAQPEAGLRAEQLGVPQLIELFARLQPGQSNT